MVTIVEPLELSLAADRPRLQALRVRMATYIPCFPDTVEIRTALEEMPLLERLAVYTNWAHRLIPPRPPQLYGRRRPLGALCRSPGCSKQAFAFTRFSPPYCFEMIDSAAVRRLTLGFCAQ